MTRPILFIRLPDWTDAFLAQAPPVFPSDEDRMRFVLALARENVAQGTGGPFAAAVFDSDGRLIAPGMNLVASANCSILHAEVVALALAELALARYDLSDGGRANVDLVSAAEPCAMCLGAVLWSGISRLVCGARDEDARAIGFDEGPKPADWMSELGKRGIAVQPDVLRAEAVSVLRHYQETGGLIYNPRRPGRPPSQD